MPSPTSTDFQVSRQQETMALARVLQACAEEPGSPTGVLCDAAQGLQRCMAPLLALNGNKIVEASLLGPIGRRTWNLPYTTRGSHSPG